MALSILFCLLFFYSINRLFVSQLIENLLNASQWIWEIMKIWTQATIMLFSLLKDHDTCKKSLQTFLVSELHEVVHFSTTMISQNNCSWNFDVWVNFQDMKITKSSDTKKICNRIVDLSGLMKRQCERSSSIRIWKTAVSWNF